MEGWWGLVLVWVLSDFFVRLFWIGILIPEVIGFCDCCCNTVCVCEDIDRMRQKKILRFIDWHGARLKTLLRTMFFGKFLMQCRDIFILK